MNTENNNTDINTSAQQIIDGKKSVRDSIWKKSLTSNEKLVMLALTELSGDDGTCVATRQKIAFMCGMPDGSAVSKITSDLSRKDVLQVIPDGHDSDGRKVPNTYKIII